MKTRIWKITLTGALALGSMLSASLLDAAPGSNDAPFRPGGEAEFAGKLAWRGKAAPAEVKALGEAIALDPEAARETLEALEGRGPEADLLRAELLYYIAVAERPERGARLTVMPGEEVAERAAPLLSHPDVAVRALAEWAIDIRMSRQCEGNYPRPWPDVAENPWMEQWLAVSGRQQLADDYLRQAFMEGAHRDPAKLTALAEDRAERARRLAKRTVEMGDADQRAAAQQALAAMEQQLDALRLMADNPDDMPMLRRQYLVTRLATRNVVMTNPDIDFDKLIFTLRNNNNANNITQGDLLHVFGADGEIVIKAGLNPEDPVKPLLNGRLGQGHLRGFDLHWDADRILFSFVEQPGWEKMMGEREEKYQSQLQDGAQINTFSAWGSPNDAKRAWWCERAHLWEMDLTSGELRQITDDPFQDDYEPAYLPNGDIIFVSDRSCYGSQCAGNPGQDKMITNLHRGKIDGSGIYALSNNKDFDRFPRVMDDGTFLFLHWEYQERHLWLPHTVWRARPDGTALDTLYKQHIPHSPHSLRHARQVPGMDKFSAIACGHHVGSVGAVFMVDYLQGVNNGEAMRNLTPNVDRTEGGYGPWKTVEEGGVPDKGGYYHNPWPLSDKSLLVNYSYNDDKHMARSYAVYYIDVWGNKELIHRDKKMSTTYVFPLKQRKTPPVIPDSTNEDLKEAYVYTGDVHEGVEGIEPGTIKYIRVSQHMPWPCVRDTETEANINFDDLHYNPSGPWSHIMGFNGWSPARSIGIVPVEEDGSAYFKVPVRQPVYFQALDENFMEVRRMRSMVTLQPGEQRGCLGCHETRSDGVGEMKYGLAQALKRSPSMPVPPSWGAAVVPSFEQHIQPILDRNCGSCHGADNPAGGIELSSRKVGDHFQSYRTMFGLKATDKTPARELHIRDWHRDSPDYTAEGHREYYKKYFNNELPGQLVSIADYKSGIEVTEPYQFGSTQSKLVTVLLEDELHREAVNMPKQDWIDLVTWIDLNAFYYDTYTYFTTMERVPVEWPDPWEQAPAGEWRLIEDENGRKKVVLSNGEPLVSALR